MSKSNPQVSVLPNLFSAQEPTLRENVRLESTGSVDVSCLTLMRAAMQLALR